MYRYLLLILLEWRLSAGLSSPTLEDNMLPTDEQVISELINSYGRGQAEEEIALNLPTDEEAFNEIKPILQSGNPFYYINGGGHFISSSFPEIDARGFHESIFDDLDDFYPISQRGKKFDPSSLAVSARGFYGDVFTDGFGNFHPVKRYFKEREGYSRQKRSYQQDDVPEKVAVSSVATGAPDLQRNGLHQCRAPECPSALWHPILSEPVSKDNASILLFVAENSTNASSTRHKRSPAHQLDWSSATVRLVGPEDDDNGADTGQAGATANRRHRLHKRSQQQSRLHRVPEITKSGFHNDLFYKGHFDTVKRDPSELQGDIFHKNFGKFETLRKRDRYGDADLRSFYAPKRRSQAGAVNADAFYTNFGSFETLKRAPPLEFDDDDPDDRVSQYPKRKPPTALLNGDAFHSNFGYFEPMKRTLAGDAFHSNFGAFDTMKRTLGGNAFHSNFGHFEPMKRTLAGDAFHSNFGRFEPMKRTLAGDAFHSNFGRFEPMKRTLAGDAFHSNFGSFDTMKRTLGGDAFHSQFGRFETMKRTPNSVGFGDNLSSRQVGSGGAAARTYTSGMKSDAKVESGLSSRYRRFVQTQFPKSASGASSGSSRSEDNVSVLDLTPTSSTRSN